MLTSSKKRLCSVVERVGVVGSARWRLAGVVSGSMISLGPSGSAGGGAARVKVGIM
jgi:hypothetical protein